MRQLLGLCLFGLLLVSCNSRDKYEGSRIGASGEGGAEESIPVFVDSKEFSEEDFIGEIKSSSVKMPYYVSFSTDVAVEAIVIKEFEINIVKELWELDKHTTWIEVSRGDTLDGWKILQGKRIKYDSGKELLVYYLNKGEEYRCYLKSELKSFSIPLDYYKPVLTIRDEYARKSGIEFYNDFLYLDFLVENIGQNFGVGQYPFSLSKDRYNLIKDEGLRSVADSIIYACWSMLNVPDTTAVDKAKEDASRMTATFLVNKYGGSLHRYRLFTDKFVSVICSPYK